MRSYYFKSNIKAEPLIWQWYAWPYLIAPSTGACNIVGRHLKIMQSYVQNPAIHAQAVKDPKMLGGPFVDLDGQRVKEIKELIEYTRESCSELIKLNHAIKETDKMLSNEGKGASLEGLYKKLPEMLRGLVEFVYDLNSRPSMRLIEPFLYKAYYSDKYQGIALASIQGDYRSFVFSTPRLGQSDEVYLQIPFSDERLDKLFKYKYDPGNIDEIIELLDVKKGEQPLFRSFFTTDIPIQKTDKNYTGDGVRVRYFGHACVLLETSHTSILFDPVISYSFDNGIPRFTFEDLPDLIDYVVITHNHLDHIMLETLLQLRYKTRHIIFPANNKGVLADPSIKLILQHTGFSSLIELSEVETHCFKDGQITTFPFLGEHCDLNILSKLSYAVQLKDKKFMFAADSNNLDEFLYGRIFDITGDIDMLFLGMECEGAPLTWTYGPLLSNPISRVNDQSRTLSGSNFDKAWSIVNKLKCKSAYVYAMGQEPWLNHVMALNYTPESIQMLESEKFIATCLEYGIESERLFGKKEWILAEYKHLGLS